MCLSETLIRPTHNRHIVNTHTQLSTMTGLNDKGTSEEEKRQTKEEVAAEGNQSLICLLRASPDHFIYKMFFFTTVAQVTMVTSRYLNNLFLLSNTQ